MTISVWADLAAWESWRTNPERTEIIGRISAVVQGTLAERIWLHDEDAPPAAV